MASSRPIAAGETYTPTDINNLRADVLDPVGGHKHNGTDGAKVPFSNLDVTGVAGSTAPAGGGKSYNEIAAHVASSQGAHGLNALAHVIGGLNSGWIIQVGSLSVTTQGNPNPYADGTITFADTGVAFSGTPFIFLSWDGRSPNGWAQAQVRSRSSSGFGWRVSCSIDGGHDPITTLYWLAIGPKAP
jgi:hypothetical protein